VKGDSVRINGDLWTIVDVAPASQLADMVAALLEDEGFVTLTRGADGTSDILTHLGAQAIGTAYVLVPAEQAERALALIAETVTDYQGGDLDALIDELASEGAEDEPNG
jgi:hypothetical protein